MVDNVGYTPGTGATVAADDIGSGILAQRVKPVWGPDGTGNDIDIASGKPLPVQLRDPSGNDLSVGGTTISTDITRPADTLTYAANDILANSTSAPTAGGFTWAGAARVSGGQGRIEGITIISSNDPALTLQGELWIFDSAVTAVNDNVAMTLSDADGKKLVAWIPFALMTAQAGTGGATHPSVADIQNLSIPFTCVGSADLRYLVKVKNAYIPASAEVLTCRLKTTYLN